MTLSANIDFGLSGHARLNGCRKFLFELLPDIFYQGFLTEMEIELWGKYSEFINGSNR
jgi:hypothetical protein